MIITYLWYVCNTHLSNFLWFDLQTKAGFPLVLSARERETETRRGGKMPPRRNRLNPSRKRLGGGIIPPPLSCLGVRFWSQIHPISHAVFLIRHSVVLYVSHPSPTRLPTRKHRLILQTLSLSSSPLLFRHRATRRARPERQAASPAFLIRLLPHLPEISPKNF